MPHWDIVLAATSGLMIDWIIKGTILLLAFALAALTARRASAAVRHALWLLPLAGLLLLPIMSLCLPAWRILPAWLDGRNLQAQTPATPTASQDPTARPRDIALKPRPYVVTPSPSPAESEQVEPIGPVLIAPAPRVESTAPNPSPSAATAEPQPASNAFARALPTIWLLGAIVTLLPVLAGRAALARLRRSASPLTDPSWNMLISHAAESLSLSTKVTLLESASRAMPMVWGIARPCLLLPREAVAWSPDRRQAVVLHELAHVRRRDCLWRLVGQLACAAFWFHPLAWVALRRMQAESEAACDDRVLSCMPRASDYAQHILDIASNLRAPLLAAQTSIALARPSRLEGRLLAILDSNRNRRGMGKTKWVATLLVLSCLLVTLGMLQAQTKPDFISATVTWTPAADRDWGKAKTIVVKDAQTITKLQSFFPRLGKSKLANPPAAWIAAAKIEFAKSDGTAIKVLTEGRSWTEDGADFRGGDFEVKGDFEGFLGTLFAASAKGNAATTSSPASASAPTSTGPADESAKTRPFRLSGRVQDVKGVGIAGANLALLERPAQDGKDVAVYACVSESDGTFRFPQVLQPLTSESRLLVARKKGYAVAGTYVDSTGAQTNVMMTMSAQHSLRGLAKDANGKPLANAEIELQTVVVSDKETWSGTRKQHVLPWTSTDKDGKFTLDELPAGELYFIAKAPGHEEGVIGAIDLVNGTMDQTPAEMPAKFESGTLEITLRHNATLIGTVVYEETNSPAAGIVIAAQGIRRACWSETTTDKDGRFELSAAPAPTNLLTMIEGKGQDMPDWTSPAIVIDKLDPSAVRDDLRIVLTKGIVVKGSAKDAAGKALKAVNISFYSSARPRQGAACQSIQTRDDGTWSFRVPPGPLHAFVQDNRMGKWQEATFDLEVAPGKELPNLDFRLTAQIRQSPEPKASVALAVGFDGSVHLQVNDAAKKSVIKRISEVLEESKVNSAATRTSAPASASAPAATSAPTAEDLLRMQALLRVRAAEISLAHSEKAYLAATQAASQGSGSELDLIDAEHELTLAKLGWQLENCLSKGDVAGADKIKLESAERTFGYRQKRLQTTLKLFEVRRKTREDVDQAIYESNSARVTWKMQKLSPGDALGAAELRVEAATLDLGDRKRLLDSTIERYKGGQATKAELDRAVLDYELAELALKSASVELQTTQRRTPATASSPASASAAAAVRLPASKTGNPAIELLPEATAPTADDLKPDASEYVIGASDVIDITVLDLYEKNMEAVLRREVSPQGTIELPLLPEPVKAAGKTARELKDAVAAAYASVKVLAKPVVAAAVAARRKNTFSVLGAVDRPGVYALDRGDMPLLEAIATCGGIIQTNIRYVYVIRPAAASAPASRPAATASAPDSAAHQRLIGIDLRKLTAGDAKMNIVIRPGDVVFVAPLSIGEFYIMGQVQRPGVYSLSGRRVTVKMAVAAAGQASATDWPQKSVLIRRTGDHQEQVIPLDIRAIVSGKDNDIFLEPDDVLAIGVEAQGEGIKTIRTQVEKMSASRPAATAPSRPATASARTTVSVPH